MIYPSKKYCQRFEFLLRLIRSALIFGKNLSRIKIWLDRKQFLTEILSTSLINILTNLTIIFYWDGYIIYMYRTYQPIQPLSMPEGTSKVYHMELGDHGVWVTYKGYVSLPLSHSLPTYMHIN